MRTELAALSWNPVSDFEQLTTFPFMVQALEAGAIVAVMAGAIGWFMVLRRQTFAGHTLSVIAFPGAAGATLAGLPIALGYFGACGLGALALSLVSRPERSEPQQRVGRDRHRPGLRPRPRLPLRQPLRRPARPASRRCSSAPSSASPPARCRRCSGSRSPRSPSSPCSAGRCCSPRWTAPSPAPPGCPTRLLALAFLLLLGMAVAATAEITGALLVFALLVTPAATAQQLTARPGPGLALSVALALAVTWVGLGIAYFSPYPVGFWVTTLSFGLYVAVRAVAHCSRGRRTQRSGCRPDARPRVHAQRLPRRHLRRARLRPDRLLRRPAQPGLRRRRAQPRRLHRRPGRRRGRDRHPGRPLRRDDPRRAPGWAPSAIAPAPTTS